MFRHFMAATIGLALLTGAAAAQTPMRVRGTVDLLFGNTLTMTTRGGERVSVTLDDPARVLAVVKMALPDIKPGSNVGIVSLPGPDGSLRAVAVTIVPAGQPVNPMTGPWDLEPSSRMTNGSVGNVTGSSDRTLTVNYGKGEQTIAVPTSAAIVTLTPGDKAMLAPGAQVVVFARKQADGALTAAAVAVGKDGVVPPM